MNYNNISIRSLTEKWALKPIRSKGYSAMFYALNREERTPSLFINFAKNQFFDFGSGVGGGPIQFIMYAKNCNYEYALELLKNSQFEIHNAFPSPLPKKSSPGIKILKHKNIVSPALVRYIEERKIPLSLARVYCAEVNYSIDENNFFAIGFKNDKNGYELRNSFWKGGNSPKHFRTIKNGKNRLIIVEGFFDFLSLLTIDFKLETEFDFIILNSIFTRSKLPFEKLEKYREIRLFLDNDKAGKETLHFLKKRLKNITDYSGLYEGYKDVNEMLMQHTNPVFQFEKHFY